MQDKFSNDSNENYPEQLKEEDKNVICKDGFCYIPTLEENKSLNNETINIFDPI